MLWKGIKMTFFKPEIKRRDSSSSESSNDSNCSKLSISDLAPSPGTTEDELSSEDEWALPDNDYEADEDNDPNVFNLN